MTNRLVTFFLVLLLAGCNSLPSQPQDPEIIREEKVASLSQQIQSSGAKVIQTGQTMRIILPSDALFNPHSANLTSNTHKLNQVARLMKLLEATSTQVIAYTDVEPTQRLNKSLATRQAEVVADYLWSKGLDTRLLYSIGYGANYPSADLSQNLGSSAYRRIEIRFQYLPLLSSLVN